MLALVSRLVITIFFFFFFLLTWNPFFIRGNYESLAFIAAADEENCFRFTEEICKNPNLRLWSFTKENTIGTISYQCYHFLPWFSFGMFDSYFIAVKTYWLSLIFFIALIMIKSGDECEFPIILFTLLHGFCIGVEVYPCPFLELRFRILIKYFHSLALLLVTLCLSNIITGLAEGNCLKKWPS